MITVENVTKRYGDKLAVDDLTFNVKPGIVTGFLGPNGAGKSTTMRLILGLDAPTSGSATIDGRSYRDLPAPLHEVGALLEARAIHTGRSAYNHLLALAQTHGIGRRARRRGHRTRRPPASPASASAVSRSAWASGSASPRRCSAIRRSLILDEPANGLDPEGILWIRNLLKRLAAEGRTVFLSSHLMAEMAQTAEHLIVIGRGRLIADTSVRSSSERASTGAAVRVVLAAGRPRSRDALAAGGARRQRRARRARGPRPDRRSRSARSRRPRRSCLHELTPHAGVARGGLHEHDQRDAVEFHAARPTTSDTRRGGRRMSGHQPPSNAPLRAVASAGGSRMPACVRSEWTKLWSLRSTRWSLLVAFLAMAGLGPLIATVQMARWNHLSLQRPASTSTRSTPELGGWHLAQLAIGVLGVLVITGEYTHRHDPLELLAVPKRLPVLGPSGSFRAVTFVLMLIAGLIAFLAVAGILTQHHVQHSSLSHGHALRAVSAPRCT